MIDYEYNMQSGRISEDNAKLFERWLVSLLRWFQINRICGPELDSERVVCMAVFLQGNALTWFNDNVVGMDH
jgi:hypothetical protein